MDDSAAPTIRMDVKALPTKAVIVYADRAEVKRLIRTEVPAGKSTLLIEGLSPVIERQSVRVEGHRHVQISQVQYEELPLNEETETHVELNRLETEREAKESQRLGIEDEIHVLRKRLECLDGVAGQIGQNVLASKGSEPNNNNTPSSFLLCNEAMENLTQFLEYYAKSAAELRQELREKERRVGEIHDTVDSLERQIDQLRCRLEYDNHKRTLRIVVKAETEGEAEIFVSYQAYCASWRPSYDIRASTSAGATAAADGGEQDAAESQPNRIQLMYYGLIEQKTDEDWTDVELVLSTATPCVAGTLPPLPTITAAFQRQQQQFRQRNYSNHRKPLSNGSEEDGGIGSFDYNEFTDAAALQRLTIARSNSDTDVNQNREQLPCSYFPIEAPATIPSGGHSHRVLIAQLDLQPTFMHETNPSKTTSALLAALVTNTSQLALLHGQASVFLNNSFICQTSMRTVLPGEQLTCSLGVDPAVKIEYRPAKRTQEKLGFMSKYTLTTHEQVINVRNAKVGEKVHLTVREPIPRAVDEKIKVSLISPDLRSGRVEACMSKDNHLEWSCTLPPGESRELLVKWTMEFPLNESVVYGTTMATSIVP
ncbi:Protein F37C4.5 [Aphelenchoides fujianensis]|nr:Protein F37C4.5 [Aphelenchoides fujianensis]